MPWRPRSIWKLVLLFAAPALAAQTPTARCDSLVAASKVDAVPIAIFIRTTRLNGELQRGQSRFISATIATAFMPPRPFTLSVFSGAPQMSALHRVAPDGAGAPRAPTITAIYRYTTTRDSLVGRVQTLRASLVPGFDSAAIEAILATTSIAEIRSQADADRDSMRLEVRFSTDSAGDAYRLVNADFPRMPVVDVVPRRDNPRPAFPATAKADSVATGEVVLRFVVDQSGSVVPRTTEVIRASGLDFLQSALVSLPEQRFLPATIRGCPVSQLVDYSFSFVLPGVDTKPPERGTRD
jgi:hypothetical protein